MAALRNIDSPQRGVLLLDKDSRVVYANLRASEIMDVELSEMVGRGLPKGIRRAAQSDLEIIDEVLDSVLAEGRVFHRYSTPVMDADGSLAGRVEIYSDITIRRELEKEILDRNAALAELNIQLQETQEQLVQSERLRALGEMAAGVAHDINNVIGIVLGNVQLARRKLDSPDDALKSLEAIELAARDAAETVRRLREIGKPADTSGYRIVDLSDIVNDVVGSAIPAWRESQINGGANVTVETNLDAGCVVFGNPVELREALANILLNAAQAADDGGRIEVTTSHDGEHVDLTVKDDGPGMSEETRKRLFDPFFTTRGAEGTGLGMSMVDAIAIRHRGKVFVESAEGCGTAVTIRIPLAHD